MRFRHTRAKKNPIARWQGRLAKWKVASLFSARDDLWLRFESWPTRTQLQSHKAGGALPLPLRGRHRRRQIPVARFEGAFAEGSSHHRGNRKTGALVGRVFVAAPGTSKPRTLPVPLQPLYVQQDRWREESAQRRHAAH